MLKFGLYQKTYNNFVSKMTAENYDTFSTKFFKVSTSLVEAEAYSEENFI